VILVAVTAKNESKLLHFRQDLTDANYFSLLTTVIFTVSGWQPFYGCMSGNFDLTLVIYSLPTGHTSEDFDLGFPSVRINSGWETCASTP
jgi:hypothetical protein